MTQTLRSFVRGGAALHVDDTGGAGLPVVFQHGLCGDAKQTAEVFPDDPRFRRITLECRGHGLSGAGDPAVFSVATFTNDVAAVIKAAASAPLVVGGISMGAAIALRLAVQRPDLVRGLILVRPAWIAGAAPENMRPNLEVAELLAAMPPEAALAAFSASDTARRLAVEAPGNLASFNGFFARAPQAVTAALLQAIAADGPGVSEEEIRALRVPALVIGNGRDFVHPFAYAEALAALIPEARLVTVTAKADDPARHAADCRATLAEFLQDFL